MHAFAIITTAFAFTALLATLAVYRSGRVSAKREPAAEKGGRR